MTDCLLIPQILVALILIAVGLVGLVVLIEDFKKPIENRSAVNFLFGYISMIFGLGIGLGLLFPYFVKYLPCVKMVV